jgi:hypothetical protein
MRTACFVSKDNFTIEFRTFPGYIIFWKLRCQCWENGDWKLLRILPDAHGHRIIYLGKRARIDF